MQRYRTVVLSFCLLFSTSFWAQQPASFLLGENQFRGIQIYDMIQDNNLNYWFATNEGIYCFNGVVYEKLECAKAKSNSAFNFVKDKKGTIYCHNLNNQVFKLANKKLTLFYELTEQEGSADMSLSLDDKNHLLISSRQVLVLNEKGKIINRKLVPKYYIGPPFTSPTGEIYYHLKSSDSVLVYKHGNFRYEQLILPVNPKEVGVFRFFKSGKSYFAIDLANKWRYQIDTKTYSLSLLDKNDVFNRSESVRIYECSTGIWVASTLPGVHFIPKNKEDSKQTYYNEYFISDVFEDADGNILLGTFDKGILVVPDIQTPDALYSFEDDPAVSLLSSKNELFIGTSKGKVYTYHQGDLVCIHDSGKRPVEAIGCSPSGRWLVFDDGQIRIRDMQTKKLSCLFEASLKDVVFISETQFYAGTNVGVYFCEILPHKIYTTPVVGLHSRVHFLDYDQTNKLLYVSTALGMKFLNNAGQAKSLLYKNQEIYPNHVVLHNGTAYLSTKGGEILLFQKGKLLRTLKPTINNKSTTIKKIGFFKNSILANTSDGFLQLDKTGNLMRSISSTYGIANKRVVDFTINASNLWVIHVGGLQQIDPDYHRTKQNSLSIRLDKIYVNDQLFNTSTKNELDPDERKIQFYFSSPSINNRETLIFEYRLLGYENAWNTLDYNARQVTFNALGPGKYTFQVRCRNQHVQSAIETFSFSIATPLYAQWWFIIFVVILFLTVVYLIYNYQLGVQRKKAEQINELNASKLTAIQSQMNPHFIFNSLNSIQDLILKKDVKNSYSYITKFSNLVRRTLSYSQKDFIEFEQEIKLLEVYLALENLRFKSNFNYEIVSDNIPEIMIPPLLIQPFVENCLVHGLLHKDGEKMLRVSFKLEEKQLQCIIEDNGIGREEAKAIRIRQKGDHESFSSQAIQRRFEILSKLFGSEYGFYYVDLKEGEEVKGTQVVLNIPYKMKF